MRRAFPIVLLLFVVLSLSGKKKERITERGSSLFYRSWRYPVVEEEKRDTMEKDTLPVLPVDTVPADTLVQDSVVVDTLPNVLTDVPKEPEKPADTLQTPPRVSRPDINTCIVYFIFDQNNFITDYSAEFDTIMAFIDYHKGKDFEVIGHTDERGTVVYNQGLSERRAKRVYEVLVHRGVDPKRLTMIGRSELELVYPHAKNEYEHLMNRRVVVRVKE
ncbi:MAG: OmpA family protein [Paludibacteraceae bacterium]|nr:OmpA family protein [Paludibacteraceae bacterium]